MAIHELKDLESYRNELQSAGVVVVDFYSTQCPPCKVVAPLYERLQQKEENQNVRFFKVNGLIEPGSEIQQEAGVNWWPTFVVYKNGKEFFRAVVPNPPLGRPLLELEEVLDQEYREGSEESQ